MKTCVHGELYSGHARWAPADPEFHVLDEEGLNRVGEVTVPPGRAEQARTGADAYREYAVTIVGADE